MWTSSGRIRRGTENRVVEPQPMGRTSRGQKKVPLRSTIHDRQIPTPTERSKRSILGNGAFEVSMLEALRGSHVGSSVRGPTPPRASSAGQALDRNTRHRRPKMLMGPHARAAGHARHGRPVRSRRGSRRPRPRPSAFAPTFEARPRIGDPRRHPRPRTARAHRLPARSEHRCGRAPPVTVARQQERDASARRPRLVSTNENGVSRQVRRATRAPSKARRRSRIRPRPSSRNPPLRPAAARVPEPPCFGSGCERGIP